ncbi:MAG: hypothetical protein IT530_19600 [Burkholderiales bacterium]|nr:hypothetical protein [Burkholderiales bacterium]
MPRDVGEVTIYVHAMNHGLARRAELPVFMRLICEIHAELMRGGRAGSLQPGELRTSQNWNGPAGCTLATATFAPPPHHAVPAALKRDRLPSVPSGRLRNISCFSTMIYSALSARARLPRNRTYLPMQKRVNRRGAL